MAGLGHHTRGLLAASLLACLTTSCLPAAGSAETWSRGDAAGALAVAAPSERTASSRRGAESVRPAPAPASQVWMPVAGARVAAIVGNFGASRGTRVHEGLDILAPEGTPVFSATDGIVRFAGLTELGGWSVQVDDGARTLWYTHLQEIAPGVVEGAAVSPDTRLGAVGRTGNAAGGPAHLHFEVVTSKGPVDPLPLLRDRL